MDPLITDSSKANGPGPEFTCLDVMPHVRCTQSLEPYYYLLSNPGKNFRDILCDSLNELIGCSQNSLRIIKSVITQLHTASLIVDDIEDDSELRRGQPSAHVKFGVPRSLNAANYAYFLAMEKLLDLSDNREEQGILSHIFCMEMLNIHRGQGRDIFWRETAYIATENEYLNMVKDKTGGLFRLAVRLMFQMCPECDSSKANKVLAFVDDLACYFQVRDDLMNITSRKLHEQKGYCDDLTEGKRSFVVLHALRVGGDEARTELLRILSSRTRDKEELESAVRLFRECNSLDYTFAWLNQSVNALRDKIVTLGGNKGLNELLRGLNEGLRKECISY